MNSQMLLLHCMRGRAEDQRQVIENQGDGEIGKGDKDSDEDDDKGLSSMTEKKMLVAIVMQEKW